VDDLPRSTDASTRDVNRVQPAITPTGDVDRWALLVGISNYAHKDLNLRFAARDARELRKTLLKSAAGAFPDDHVLDLVDEDATLANLTKALRTFLKKPAADDLVVLFLACHGSRDRDRPDNLYLLPHDTDPLDISGTALPMREVELALKETLHSRRVVILVDTCHSGGLGEAFAGIRAAHDDVADLNAYLSALSTSRGGVSLMTSAMATESSIEGEQWGKGHGVFTHFLLEGLAGKADHGPPYDSVITVGELFDFVQRRVKEETKGSQHPHISANADRSLVLAVTGSLSARQHLELAERLGEAAELLGEPTCWRGAAVQYGEAIRLGRAPERGVDHALALFRSGDAGAAEQVLRTVGEVPGARRALGLIQLACGHGDDAKETLLTPTPVEPWADMLFSSSLPRGRRVAMLVALDSVDPAAYDGWDGRLSACVSEARAISEVLETRFYFDERVHLFDDEATAAAIRTSLSELVGRSAPCEAVVVCLSGHGGQVPASGEPGRETDSTFLAFDGQMTSAEIDVVLRQSAAGRTTLIVSAAHSGRFAERAMSGGYEAIASCAENQLDRDGVELGLFMEALLPNLAPGVKCDTVAQATRAALGNAVKDQEPQFAVDGDRTLLVGDIGGGQSSSGGAVVAQVMLGVTAAAGTETLDQIAELVTHGDVPETTTHALIAEYWRRGQLDRLGDLPSAFRPTSPVIACAAASAAARGSIALTFGEALKQIRALPALVSNPMLLSELQTLIRQTRSGADTASRLRAVLVGLSELSDGRPGIQGARENVAAVRTALVDAGALAEHVTVLLDGDATAKAVRAGLRRSGGRGHQNPVLVYWCGPGTPAEMQCFDGEALSDTDVASLAGPTATVVAEGLAAALPDLHGPPPDRPRLIVFSPNAAGKARSASTAGHRQVPRRSGHARNGRLTVALVEAIRQGDRLGGIPASTLTAANDQVTAVGGESEMLLVDPLTARVDGLVDRIRASELEATALLVERLLEQRNGIDPEAQLQLGILRAQVGEFDGAVSALERAIDQFGADSSGEARARLHLGRVLLESERDRPRAVSECRLATKRDGELAAAWFWLGRALAELVKHETAAEASDALRAYLVRGAPLGRRSEVRELLGAMAGQAAPQRSP
jgi:hypothetical protein